MELSSKAKDIYSQINQETTKLGDLRKIAKDIKKGHELALELWSTGGFSARLLATLIMDKKLITNKFIDQIDEDIQNHNLDERNQLADWQMARGISYPMYCHR